MKMGIALIVKDSESLQEINIDTSILRDNLPVAGDVIIWEVSGYTFTGKVEFCLFSIEHNAITIFVKKG